MKALARTLILALVAAILTLQAAPPALAGDGGTVAGRVVDASNAAVAGATVRVALRSGAERLTATDKDGAYHVADLPPGDYVVEITAPSFRVETIPSVRVEGGATRALDVTLRVAAVAEQITVTASNTPQTRDEVAKSTDVVTREETDARGVVGLPEALSGVAGLRVQRQGGPGTLTALKFRGLPSYDTAVLVDDMRVRDASDLQGSFAPFFEDLTLTNLDRIEVVRGAGSTLYGTNAVGGVINLIPARGAGAPRFEALAEGGSLGTFHGRLRGEGGTDRFDLSAGFDQWNVTRGVDGNDDYRNSALGVRGGVRLTDRIEVSGNLMLDGSRLNLNGDPFFVGPDPLLPFNAFATEPVRFVGAPDDPDDRRDGRAFAGSVALDHVVTSVWSYTARYTATRTRRELLSGPGAAPDFVALVGPFAFDNDGDGVRDVSGSGNSLYRGSVDTVDMRNRLALGSHNLVTAGFELERESFFQYAYGPFGSAGGAYNLYGLDFDFDGVNDASRDSQRTGAVFAFDQTSWLDGRLQIGLGARYQRFRVGDSEVFYGTANESEPSTASPQPAPASLVRLNRGDAWTGDGSIGYAFRSTGTRVWAHVGNSFRAPSLYERFSTISGPDGVVRAGDPTIAPERSVSADGGVEQVAFDGRLRAGATYFYTRLQTQIDFASFFDPVTFESTDPLGLGRFYGYVNTRGGLARGVELTAKLAPIRSLALSAAYTFTNSDRVLPSRLATADGRVLDAGTAFRAVGIPDHTFSVQAVETIGRLTVGADLYAQSSHDAQLFEPAYFASRLFTFDGYARVNLQAGYTFPVNDRTSLQVFGRVENLTDADILENGVRVPGVSGYGGLKVRF